MTTMAFQLFQPPLPPCFLPSSTFTSTSTSTSSSNSSLSSLQTLPLHNYHAQLLPPRLSAPLRHHCQNTSRGSSTRRRRSTAGIVFVGKEETQLRFPSTEFNDQDDEDDDEEEPPTPQDLEDISQIKRVLELLKKNRDMIFSEVKLTVMIDDPREVERRRLLGIDESEVPTREDLAAVLEEVNDGKIPKNRVALRMLAEEMVQWPNLEVEIKKKKRGKSQYAETTDTGIDPEVAAKRLNIDWDSAADIADPDVTDDTEVPPVLGYGALYLVTAFPVIIGISVVLILFYNSLQ